MLVPGDRNIAKARAGGPSFESRTPSQEGLVPPDHQVVARLPTSAHGRNLPCQPRSERAAHPGGGDELPARQRALPEPNRSRGGRPMAPPLDRWLERDLSIEHYLVKREPGHLEQ